MRVTAQFLDKQKAALELDPWEWNCDKYDFYSLLETKSTRNDYGRLKAPVPNLMVTLLQSQKIGGRGDHENYYGRLQVGSFEIAVAPICMARKREFGSGSMLMRRQITMERRISFPLEDLKKLSEIKLKVETFVDKSK